MDVLIGLDCADLHFSFKDIRGAPGQPVAHLTPLGWTCIGAMDDNKQTKLSNNFACTFFSVGQTDTEKVNLMLQKFWEVYTSGTEEFSILKAEDNLVLNMTETSIAYNNGCYRVAIPWKEEFINLPNNYEMAEKRLYNLERRLFREPEIAEEYKKIIGKHLEK